MEIRLRGEMTFADIWQALFEQLCTLEDEYAVRYSRGATLFLNPTDGLGEEVRDAKRCTMIGWGGLSHGAPGDRQEVSGESPLR